MTIRKIGPAGIPNLGLGTFKMDGDTPRRIVSAALAEGYRHIDTAQAYENEAEVGQGIRDAGVPRDQVFLTTKILPKDFAADDFRRAAEQSLRDLGTDYVDLLLLHWPSREVPLSETLPVLDRLIEEGKVRNGGVSNFTIAQLTEAQEILQAPVAANQIEFHPFIDQSKLLGFMQQRDMPFEAYSPLAQGKIMDEPVLSEIAEAHGVSEAEVTVAWILSKPGAVAIPKTAKEKRLGSNLAAAELQLSADEIARIDGLARPDGRIVSPDSLAPDWDD
ncbi:aldo/keto reductase [Limimaricola pyoseonensis]|uniref:Aldo/keto reductase n=1 Tax=Limimaricola pyoseonensis TaxID=521013 RepID=A0A1G7FQQ0_9RHOB|nr:aldo/keto reductase [Limimaricola pyoseonensis]SDE78233.1 Aldo/keto reductase [Limimaricola pyoseonensis]